MEHDSMVVLYNNTKSIHWHLEVSPIGNDLYVALLCKSSVFTHSIYHDYICLERIYAQG